MALVSAVVAMQEAVGKLLNNLHCSTAFTTTNLLWTKRNESGGQSERTNWVSGSATRQSTRKGSIDGHWNGNATISRELVYNNPLFSIKTKQWKQQSTTDRTITVQHDCGGREMNATTFPATFTSVEVHFRCIWVRGQNDKSRQRRSQFLEV